MYRAYRVLVVIDVGAATIEGWSLLCLNDAFFTSWGLERADQRALLTRVSGSVEFRASKPLS
jgi:hypothetical protein